MDNSSGQPVRLGSHRPSTEASDRNLAVGLGRLFSYGDGMNDTNPAVTPDRDSVDERAHLLPEELAAGSVDPQEQAEVILEESAERTEDPEGTREESTQVP